MCCRVQHTAVDPLASLVPGVTPVLIGVHEHADSCSFGCGFGNVQSGSLSRLAGTAELYWLPYNNQRHVAYMGKAMDMC
jgi:hypothetical protein